MNKNILYFSILLGFLLSNCKSHPPEQELKKPNIILIMADDLGMETLGCYGGESYTTPNLDQMAILGMQFANCYSTPLCTPSRVQLMTGKYNFRNYVGFGILDPNEPTFAHRLKAEGYQTCVAGKWQLYGNKRQQELVNGKHGSLPDVAGFDDWCLWQVQERGYRYKHPTLTIKGQGTQTFPDAYGPDLFVDHLEGFMEQNKDSSFFIYYPMALTHDPFQVTPADSLFEAFDPEIHTRNDATWFGSMVEYMDYLVGRIVQKTEALDIAENTLILFIGDNGTDRKVISTWNQQRIAGRKGYPVEWGTHVPFIAYWPGTIKAGQVNKNLIDFTDFMPSLLDVANTLAPLDFFTDGISFYPQLINQDSKTRDWIFCHYAPNWGIFENARYAQDTEWKLYADGRFFNFKADLAEENPLNTSTLDEREKKAYHKLQQALAGMEEKK
jgi:arylsulfatase A-like enzyme